MMIPFRHLLPNLPRGLCFGMFLSLSTAQLAEAQVRTITGIDPFNSIENYAVFDASDASRLSVADLVLSGQTITGGNSITRHPVTGTYWALLKLSGQTGRELVTIDPDTLAITRIGNTGSPTNRNFSSLTFNADGTILYAVTGDGSPNNPETLFTLDQSTAAPTVVCTLGNGADGEVIAFNSNDSKLYHFSGNSTRLFERIDDITGPACTVTSLSTGNGEIFGAVYDSTQNLFYIADINSKLKTIQPDGLNETEIGSLTVPTNGGIDLRGLVLRYYPEITLLGNGNAILDDSTTPAESNNTDFGFTALQTPKAKTYTISNEGLANLTLTGNPTVSISGINASDFQVSIFPNSPVAAGNSTTFEIKFTPSDIGVRGATVTISNNDLSEATFNFDIQGTGDIDTDLDGIPNTTDPDDDNDGIADGLEAGFGTNPLLFDTDGDGVGDGQELADETNPLDVGSYRDVLQTSFCSEWNGFFQGRMWNIMEHVNLSSGLRSPTTSLFSIEGILQSQQGFSILAGAQTDILVHDMVGRIAQSYGNVCSSYSGTAGDVDGRMVHYLPSGNSYDFAFAMSFSNGLKGSQFVPTNTYTASLDPSDAGDFVANYIAVTNRESTPQSGLLLFYGQDGTELGSFPATLPASSRQDFSGHQFGTNIVGLAEWRPNDANARFQVKNVRYYYSTSNPGIESFDSATVIEASKGNGEPVVVALDTRGQTAVLEVSNTLSSSAQFVVHIYNGVGALVLNETITLAAHATIHYVADGLLDGGLGTAVVDGSTATSALVTGMHYGRTPTAGLKYTYASSAFEATGALLRGSYNTFLAQGCSLFISNPNASAASATVSLKRYEGTVVVSGDSVNVPAFSTVEYDACSKDAADNYGVVSVTPAVANSLVSSVVRKGASDAYRFNTLVR